MTSVVELVDTILCRTNFWTGFMCGGLPIDCLGYEGEPLNEKIITNILLIPPAISKQGFYLFEAGSPGL